MTQRILSSALVAGLLAGLLAALLNIATLVPMILEAETFEAAMGNHHSTPVESAGQDHAAPAEEPDGGGGGPAWGRNFGTIATTLVAYMGFGLVLGAAMALAARSGHGLTARRGALWGMAAFAAVHLAPAAGLAPELPGMAAGPLVARQAWWVLCVGSTALGLVSLAFGQSLAAILVGLALVALPHLVGAPVGPGSESLVPPSLAAEFAARSLGVAALTWVVLGTITGGLAARAAP